MELKLSHGDNNFFFFVALFEVLVNVPQSRDRNFCRDIRDRSPDKDYSKSKECVLVTRSSKRG